MKISGGNYLELGYLDLLSSQDTPVHRLDPRAKVITVLIFTLAVISFDRYRVAALLPFVIFPLALIILGNLPLWYLLRRLAVVLPFILLVGIFNPLIDREALLQVGSVTISGGWLSFCSILLRSVLTVLTLLALVATTGFIGVCAALDMLGMPRVFSLQLLFMYRYLFVLADEGGRMARARELRSFGNRGGGIQSFVSLVGHLLLRTFDRAQKIYTAMLSRGFQGQFHLRRQIGFGYGEIVFIAGWSCLFILFRFVDIPAFVGGIITGAGR